MFLSGFNIYGWNPGPNRVSRGITSGVHRSKISSHESINLYCTVPVKWSIGSWVHCGFLIHCQKCCNYTLKKKVEWLILPTQPRLRGSSGIFPSWCTITRFCRPCQALSYTFPIWRIHKMTTGYSLAQLLRLHCSLCQREWTASESWLRVGLAVKSLSLPPHLPL